ncbi:MAG: hypothetical protein HFI57_03495 [Lachnospiraceae bacterium]|nr:hypothetical protein [Lachnospiraceae bacterium]
MGVQVPWAGLYSVLMGKDHRAEGRIRRGDNEQGEIPVYGEREPEWR